MKKITPNAYGANALGEQNITLGWDGAVDPVGTATIVSLGLLPANCIIKAALGTLVEAEGTAGNLLLAWRQDGGSPTTLLTIDANGTAGARTDAPATYDGTSATTATGCLLDTATSTNYELVLLGSAALDSAKAVIQIPAFFGVTVGADGTANAFL